MRRALVLILAGALLGLTLSASATSSENYKDQFDSISWSGSNGSLDWSGPWNGTNGVQVVSSGNCASGNCMRMSTLLGLSQVSATRGADTSMLGDMSLRYDLKATTSLLGSLLGSKLDVDIHNGTQWVPVKEHDLGAAQTASPTIDISAHRSEDFLVRFVFSPALLGGQVFIDNVEIQGELIEEPTTPSTTPTTEPDETTTTTTEPDDTTTTTQPSATTTTTRPRSTTTTDENDESTPPSSSNTTTATTTTTTTTTTIATTTAEPGASTTSITSPSTSTTTTTIGGPLGPDPGGPGSGGGGTVPEGSGLRAAVTGLQANFQGDLYGEARTVIALEGVDLQADYKMVVEVIKSSWAWVVLLGLIIAWAIVTGLDRRRGPLAG